MLRNQTDLLFTYFYFYSVIFFSFSLLRFLFFALSYLISFNDPQLCEWRCVTRKKPLRWCVIMALDWLKLDLPVMTPPEQSSPLSLAGLAIRLVGFCLFRSNVMLLWGLSNCVWLIGVYLLQLQSVFCRWFIIDCWIIFVSGCDGGYGPEGQLCRWRSSKQKRHSDAQIPHWARDHYQLGWHGEGNIIDSYDLFLNYLFICLYTVRWTCARSICNRLIHDLEFFFFKTFQDLCLKFLTSNFCSRFVFDYF